MMFFFFIGGIQPKTIRLDDTPRVCPICGTTNAYLKRTDHYLSLFFIPILRVKKGEPFLYCEYCKMPVEQEHRIDEFLPSYKLCSRCGKRFDPSFNFCPFCGKRI